MTLEGIELSAGLATAMGGVEIISVTKGGEADRLGLEVNLRVKEGARVHVVVRSLRPMRDNGRECSSCERAFARTHLITRRTFSLIISHLSRIDSQVPSCRT